MFSRNIINLWLFPKNENNKQRVVTINENKIASKLPPLKAEEYIFSRGCVRYALSSLFKIPPLDIPLEAPPGGYPILLKNMGFITFSHCKDALFVGWSYQKIGVDIESSSRVFAANAITNRFYCEEEKQLLSSLSKQSYRQEALKLWVLKEASIKWQNGKISIDLPNWKISDKKKSAYHKLLDIKINTLNIEYKSWYLGLAYNSRDVEIKEILEQG